MAKRSSFSLLRRTRRALTLRGWFLKRVVLLTIRRRAKWLDRGLERQRWRRVRAHSQRRRVDEGPRPYLVGNTSYHSGMAHAVMEWASAYHLSQRYDCQFASGVTQPDFGGFFGVENAGFPTGAEVESLPGARTILLPQQGDRDTELTQLIRNGEWGGARQYVLVRSPGRPDVDVAESFPYLRKLYEAARENDPLPILLDMDAVSISVAVHVRRGDVEMFTAGERRMLPVDFFINLCLLLQELLPAGQVRFSLFSQGSREELSTFSQLDKVEYFVSSDKTLSLETHEEKLRESPTVAFHQLKHADILIASPSYFSFLAGGISDALVLVPSAFERNLKVTIPLESNFVVVEDDPKASRDAIAQALAHRGLISAKGGHQDSGGSAHSA